VAQQTYVFDAELDGFQGVTRTISARADLTLVDLHYALQGAFGWDDDHLYAFWLDGSFWARDAERYTHPREAACPSAATSRPKSAQIRLDQLGLAVGRRLAYVFDFGSEWRVRLRVREIAHDQDSASPRLLDSAGIAPPQYGAIEARRRERVYVSADGGST